MVNEAKTIGEALLQARVEAGLTHGQLALLARTSRAAIHAYETGRREPLVSTAARLFDACGWALQPVGPSRRTDKLA